MRRSSTASEAFVSDAVEGDEAGAFRYLVSSPRLASPRARPQCPEVPGFWRLRRFVLSSGGGSGGLPVPPCLGGSVGASRHRPLSLLVKGSISLFR